MYHFLSFFISLSYSNYRQLVCKLPKLTLEHTERSMFSLSHKLDLRIVLPH